MDRATILEICVESFDDARHAVAAGADRIEYCSALGLGGLTPGVGALSRMVDLALPCMVMIRPRPGDFVFSRDEVDIMLREIAFARDCGASGLVLGAAKANGTLDFATLTKLRQAAGDLPTTLHRVFDETPDPFVALEQAIDLGFDRVLTSGQAASALAGADVIARLVDHANGRIGILPGAGITPDNVQSLLAQTGVVEIHASCKYRPAGAGDGVDAASAHADMGYAAQRVAVDGAQIAALRAAMVITAGA